MKVLNPENKCAQLFIGDIPNLGIADMFTMQKKLQDFYASKGKAIDLDTSSFKEKVDNITIQMRNMTSEFIELINVLPHKEWKTYSPEELEDFIDEEHRLEVLYEYIDMWHFFMNIGLLLGIDGETFQKLYYTKNKENFDRQNRGY